MGYKVIWTDEAIDDLRHAVAFIARDNPAAAVKLGEAILRKSMLLADHPRLGRVLQKLRRENIREIPIAPYWLIYEIDEKASAIFVRVMWHGARQDPELR